MSAAAAELVEEVEAEEEEAASPVTWMAYTLALAWLISYACFLWVESVPTQLPCAWGIHGCAPHTLCEAEWPPSLFSRPTCEQLAPRTLPRNHPPVPAGAGAGGLCAAALASMGAARCRNQGPPDRPEWRRAGFTRARARLGPPRAPASLGQSAACAALAGHIGVCFRRRRCPLAAVAHIDRGCRG